VIGDINFGAEEAAVDFSIGKWFNRIGMLEIVSMNTSRRYRQLLAF
jgi:hypothetical protein